MTAKWVYQPPYSSSRATFVRGSWQFRTYGGNANAIYRSHCPHCDEPIRSRKMASGKVIHFDNAPGLRDSKHRCLHILDAYSTAPAAENLELFDYGPFEIETHCNPTLKNHDKCDDLSVSVIDPEKSEGCRA